MKYRLLALLMHIAFISSCFCIVFTDNTVCVSASETAQEEVSEEITPEEGIPEAAAPAEEAQTEPPEEISPAEEAPETIVPAQELPEAAAPAEEAPTEPSEEIVPAEETPETIVPAGETAEAAAPAEEAPTEPSEEIAPAEEAPETIAPAEETTETAAPAEELPAETDSAAAPAGEAGFQTALQQAPETGTKAARTILLYDCGADLETKAGLATYNLKQILQSNFSKDDQVRLIVMTGGSDKWHLEKEYLYDPETGDAPEEGISVVYNQIWEAKGLDAAENPGKLVLLDRDGILGDGAEAKKAEGEYIEDEIWGPAYVTDDVEWMTDPEVLKAFIDYGAEHFPADKYDLILWDHGCGVCYGFGSEVHDRNGAYFGGAIMSFQDFVGALAETSVVKNGAKFDFINFDACLMNGLESNLALSDYADYYIASADTEPGFGQYYTGWLNALGENPEKDTFELGKILVDDFLAFYNKEEGDGSTQEGTLGIMDLQKLVKSGLIESMTSVAGKMISQATTTDDHGDLAFYDELNSFYKSIRYADMVYSDLGNMLEQISIVMREITAEEVSGDPSIYDNEYVDAAQSALACLRNPDIIYAGGTDGEVIEGQFVRKPDGSISFSPLRSSGMQIFFPEVKSPGAVSDYATVLESLMSRMPEGDSRVEFLNRYLDAMYLYAAIPVLGRGVDDLIDSGQEKSSITVDGVKNQLGGDSNQYGDWVQYVSPLLTRVFGGEEGASPWLQALIRQQAQEAADRENIVLESVREPDGTGYRISIDETRQRVIDSIRNNAVLELPAFEQFMEEHPEYDMVRKWCGSSMEITLGSVVGTQEWDMELTDQGMLADFVRWYNNDTCIWNLDAMEPKWYALRDADGNLHAAAAERYGNTMLVPVVYDADGTPGMIVLTFEGEELTEIAFWQKGGSRRRIKPADLKDELTTTSAVYVNYFGKEEYYLPISWTDFTITPDNVDLIRLIYTDISEIPDIGDIDGDGKAFQEEVVLRDIYGYEWDLTELTQNPADELTSIWLADALPSVYNGKEQAAEITVDGVTLKEGEDYFWEKLEEEDSFTDAGTYKVVLYGVGEYLKAAIKDFVIQPAPIECTDVDGIKDQIYTGAALGQSPVIRFGDLVLQEGRDYTLSYRNNIETGKAVMIIQGIGNFTGTLLRDFAILPAPADPETNPAAAEPGNESVPAPADPASGTGAEAAEGECRTAPAVTERADVPPVRIREAPKTGDSQQYELWILLLLMGMSIPAARRAVKERRQADDR